MKKNILIGAFMLCTAAAMAQDKNHRYGIMLGGSIQHYNGNLGNSFFKFRTTCFGGGTASFGRYMNRSFDLVANAGAGFYGYCQTDADVRRLEDLELRCPGCTDKIGMVELRAFMFSGNIVARYKFANGILLKEKSRIAPSVYAGIGLSHLSDNMKRKCVNVGNFLTINAGAEVRYNITDKFHVGYTMGLGCFATKKVYVSREVNPNEMDDHQDEVEKMERRRDLVLQNSLSIGLNF